jgi:hypothetical protein
MRERVDIDGCKDRYKKFKSWEYLYKARGTSINGRIEFEFEFRVEGRRC